MFLDHELEFIYHILFRGTREDLEQDTLEARTVKEFYKAFEHVRLVPFKTLTEHPRVMQNEIEGHAWRHYQDSIVEFKRKNLEIEDDHKFLQNPKENSYLYHYRWIIKMQWLLNDIMSKGLREPITVIPWPKIKDGQMKFRLSYHPGTFRFKAFSLLDLNPDCIVFDFYNLFPDCPSATLNEILDQYSDDVSDFEIAVLPNNDNAQTPQILNRHRDSINSTMTKNLINFERTVRGHWDSDINIFIGYDSRHTDATNVCHNSICASTALPILKEHRIKICHLDLSKIPEYDREYANQSTEFTYSRFLAPYLSDYKGWSIFVDDDFIFTRSPLHLLYYIDASKAVSVVKHDFSEKYGKKFNNEKDVWYPKKLWSSLMVFNNEHEDCKKLTPELINKESGKYLHQFEWTDESKIGSIPKKWNWCEGYDDINNIYDSWGLHWTRGGPWVEDMVDVSHIEGLEIYDAYRNIQSDAVEESRHNCFVKLSDYYDTDGFHHKKDSSKTCLPLRRED